MNLPKQNKLITHTFCIITNTEISLKPQRKERNGTRCIVHTQGQKKAYRFARIKKRELQQQTEKI